MISMICAWCHTPISRGRAAGGYACNFGMCPECLAERLARLAPPASNPRARRPLPRAIAARAAAPVSVAHATA